jgi:uncharacterized protein YjbJ (UPF0337 family)
MITCNSTTPSPLSIDDHTITLDMITRPLPSSAYTYVCVCVCVWPLPGCVCVFVCAPILAVCFEGVTRCYKVLQGFTSSSCLLRLFLGRSRKQMMASWAKRVSRQEARGKRQEARGKRQEARGKRQEARGKTQDARRKTQDARRKTQDARRKTATSIHSA